MKLSISYDVFCKTIQIGEQLFNLCYSDYRDAYEHSSKYFTGISEHFIDYFQNHSDCRPGTYEYDLLRYFLIKAIEHRIASDLFANTSRGNVCDVFRSPFEIKEKSYPTNLPKHLEILVNSKQSAASQLANALMSEMNNQKDYSFSIDVLNAVQFIGHTIGYRLGEENAYYKGYPCSEMLTRNEINEIAGENLCKWLAKNGFEIEGANFTRDTVQDIIATKDGTTIFLILSAEIAPTVPAFSHGDLDSLYDAALDGNAVPFYASMNIASVNEEHFNDGVILYGDQTQYRVNAVDVLELSD